MHINTGRIFSFIWKYINTIFIGPYHLESIADGNAFQSGLGSIPGSVAVTVEINGPPDGKCIFPHGIGGLRSEEQTSELQSLMRNSYAVFFLKKKNISTQVNV